MRIDVECLVERQRWYRRHEVEEADDHRLIMGLTSQAVTVRPSRTSKRKTTVTFLVDSGAVYSLVPATTLRNLGLRPYRELES